MRILEEMPINDVIELYYEKHHALRQGDLVKLSALKNKCPGIFDKRNDDEIREIIEYAKKFQESPRYRELMRIELKKKLSIIKPEPEKVSE